jgi:TPR repeat protein
VVLINVAQEIVMKRELNIFIVSLFLLFAPLHATGAQRVLAPMEIKDASGKSMGLYKESHALVIGVSEYMYWPKLPGVRADVEAVKLALEKVGFQVEVVMDVDLDKMEKAFNSFIGKYGHGADNRLLFYYAGHGHTLKLAYGGEMGYIVPKDAPNPVDDRDGFLKKALDMQRIEVFAKQIESKHALFLFDSCFSGSLFALSRAVPEHITYKTSKPVRQFITAGGADETVPDRSVFREQFVAALSGEEAIGKDGYVTGAELGDFLEKTVTNYSKGTQHPQYGKIRDRNLDKGDFVFALKTPVGGESVPVVASVPEAGRLREEQQKPVKEKEQIASLPPTDFKAGTQEIDKQKPMTNLPPANFKTGAIEADQQKLVAECDRLAASPVNPETKGQGVMPDKIDAGPAIAACQLAVEAVPDSPRLQFQLARALQKDKKYEEALKWYRKAVEQNYAPAQNNLGAMYKEGQGVNKDLAETAKWYRKAADQGDALGQANLGGLYEAGLGVNKDYAEALNWYRKATDQGLALAQARLGNMYIRGHGVNKDNVEALNWYRKAADQGFAPAQAVLGGMYYHGQGVNKDTVEALNWYRKAADQGNASAQSNLGLMYEHGHGVNKDSAEALNWYRKSAEQGYPPGQSQLGYMYEKGTGVNLDYAEALRWYRKAADQGDAWGQNNLGAMYGRGLGVNKDNDEAAKWYHKSADQGNTQAKLNLAILVRMGVASASEDRSLREERQKLEAERLQFDEERKQLEEKKRLAEERRKLATDTTETRRPEKEKEEVPVASLPQGDFKAGVAALYRKDYATALRHLKPLAEQGDATAQYNIGLLYYQGQGVTKDYDEAAKWYRKSADQGNADGQLFLGIMYQYGQGMKKDSAEAEKWYRKAAEQEKDLKVKQSATQSLENLRSELAAGKK